jgi:hypothetical protein
VNDERARRIGHNEALARKVNERLEDLNDTFAEFSGRFQIVCECGDSECSQQFAVTPEEYAALRADATTFAVIPGHEEPDVETVVEKHERYDVVRKLPGIPEQIARATDPS